MMFQWMVSASSVDYPGTSMAMKIVRVKNGENCYELSEWLLHPNFNKCIFLEAVQFELGQMDLLMFWFDIAGD